MSLAKPHHETGLGQDIRTETTREPQDVERLSVVSLLLGDSSIASESERVARFVELTGHSQATYYRDRELLLAAHGEEPGRVGT